MRCFIELQRQSCLERDIQEKILNVLCSFVTRDWIRNSCVVLNTQLWAHLLEIKRRHFPDLRFKKRDAVYLLLIPQISSALDTRWCFVGLISVNPLNERCLWPRDMCSWSVFGIRGEVRNERGAWKILIEEDNRETLISKGWKWHFARKTTISSKGVAKFFIQPKMYSLHCTMYSFYTWPSKVLWRIQGQYQIKVCLIGLFRTTYQNFPLLDSCYIQ